MISEAKHYGRSKIWSSAVDITLCAEVARLNEVTMTAASKKVKAEDARHFTTLGGPIYYVRNSGGTHAFDFCDFGGNVIANVPTGKVLTALLPDKSSANGTWQVIVKTPLS